MLLKNGRVLCGDFEFKSVSVVTEGDRIAAVGETHGDSVLDCTGCYVVPGLIDVHTHGCLGYDYLSADEKGLSEMAERMLQCGVTSFLPTLLTAPKQAYIEAAGRIKNMRSGARVIGVQLEGPYFSHSHKGAQNPAYIREASIDEFFEINGAFGGTVKIISLAPEGEGAYDFISAVKDFCRVAIGHTAADYDTARGAILRGASQITHTFNGMPPLHHREPGVIGAALDSDVLCECICDGFHLHPATVRMLFAAVTDKRVVLVSDSIAPAFLTDGDYTLGGLDVSVSGGRAFLRGTDTIAGSTSSLLDCVKCAIAFGVRAESAFRAATLNAAVSAGVSDTLGSIEVGKTADLLVLDGDMNLRHVIQNGVLVK